MKNGVIHLKVYRGLDNIRARHNIDYTAWAEASGMDLSRISELNRMLRLTLQGHDPASVGRAFTVQKCADLLRGLKTIIGGDVLKKELKDLIKNTSSDKEALLLMVLALPEDDEKSVRLYLEAVLDKK